MTGGYVEEARSWREWLVRAVAGRPADARILYGVTGERLLHEWELPWLPGYDQHCPEPDARRRRSADWRIQDTMIRLAEGKPWTD